MVLPPLHVAPGNGHHGTPARVSIGYLAKYYKDTFDFNIYYLAKYYKDTYGSILGRVAKRIYPTGNITN